MKQLKQGSTRHWKRSPLILSLMKPKGLSKVRCTNPDCHNLTKFDPSGIPSRYCSKKCAMQAIQYAYDKDILYHSLKENEAKRIYTDKKKGLNIMEIARKYHLGYGKIQHILKLMKYRDENSLL